MMTTWKNCHLNVWFSGGEAGARVSCVSHDAVCSVPRPILLLGSQTTVMFLHVLSVPIFGLFSLSIMPFFVPTMCSWFSSDLSNEIPLPQQGSPWCLIPDDNPRCSGVRILNKMVSASGHFHRCDLGRTLLDR